MMAKRILAGFWMLGFVVACGGGNEKADQFDPKREYVAFGSFVAGGDSLFPRIAYFDGALVSVNDRCAVRKVKLNPKMPPAYVNGRPVGFC